MPVKRVTLTEEREVHVRSLYSKLITIFFIITTSAFTFGGILSEADLLPGTHSVSFEYNGHHRHFYVHIPETSVYEKYPVVIMLHGGVSNSNYSMKRFGWVELSDKEGFIAIFPDALPPVGSSSPDNVLLPQSWWKALNFDPREIVFDDPVDDEGFTAEIIKILKEDLPIDENRIFIAGYSNGGKMAMYLGLKLSNFVAAIATVSGFYDFKGSEVIQTPISIMIIAGMDDPFNPYYGGYVIPPWSIDISKREPVETILMKWVNLLGLPEEPIKQQENENEKFVLYSNGKTDIYFYAFKKLGHFWPQADLDYPLWFFHGRYDEVNATELIWEFFKTHPKW